MGCPGGIHCVTGGDAWASIVDEEPPRVLGWWTGALAIVLYTRSPTATIAFVLIAQVAYELLHTFFALFTFDQGGGPLPPDPGGLLGLLFGPHQTPERLFMMYPLFSILGAVQGYILVVGWGSPIYLQSYFETSERAGRIGYTTWLWRNLGYTLQLALVTYLPNVLVFGIFDNLVGSEERIGLLFLWLLFNLLLILTFWRWNSDGFETVWTSRNGVSARSRHNQFYLAWALATFGFWLPTAVLLPTELPSHVRALIGVLIVFLATLRHVPFFLEAKVKEGEEPR